MKFWKCSCLLYFNYFSVWRYHSLYRVSILPDFNHVLGHYFLFSIFLIIVLGDFGIRKATDYINKLFYEVKMFLKIKLWRRQYSQKKITALVIWHSSSSYKLPFVLPFHYIPSKQVSDLRDFIWGGRAWSTILFNHRPKPTMEAQSW